VRGQLERQRPGHGDRRPADLGLEFLRRVLHARVHDTAHEVDVGHPQPARLGHPQPGERAEQDSRVQAFRHRVDPGLPGGETEPAGAYFDPPRSY
jgi:hypothetical protein